MSAISLILRNREEFHKALEYLQDILKLEPSNGAAWGSLGTSFIPMHSRLGTTVANNDPPGHCYLMTDDLQQSYAAYQNAISYLADRRVRETLLLETYCARI